MIILMYVIIIKSWNEFVVVDPSVTSYVFLSYYYIIMILLYLNCYYVIMYYFHFKPNFHKKIYDK